MSRFRISWPLRIFRRQRWKEKTQDYTKKSQSRRIKLQPHEQRDALIKAAGSLRLDVKYAQVEREALAKKVKDWEELAGKMKKRLGGAEEL